MPLIVKTSTAVPTDGAMNVAEKVAKGTAVGVGDEIFIWTTETAVVSGSPLGVRY